MQRGFQRISMRRLGECFARVSVERRFRIKSFDVAVAAREKDPDYRLGSRREIWLTSRGMGDCRPFHRAHDPVSAKHGPEREARETHAEVRKEQTPRRSATAAHFLPALILHNVILAVAPLQIT
jgi:hypothetical protein